MRPDPDSKAGKLTSEAADLMAKASEAHVPTLTELGGRAYWGIVLEDTLDRLHEAVMDTRERLNPEKECPVCGPSCTGWPHRGPKPTKEPK